MTATTYRVSTKNDVRPAFAVRATTYERAAEIANHKLNGRRAFARRTTGNHGMSGWFTSYYALDSNVSNSTGYAFHVM